MCSRRDWNYVFLPFQKHHISFLLRDLIFLVKADKSVSPTTHMTPQNIGLWKKAHKPYCQAAFRENNSFLSLSRNFFRGIRNWQAYFENLCLIIFLRIQLEDCLISGLPIMKCFYICVYQYSFKYQISFKKKVEQYMLLRCSSVRYQ